MLASPTRPAMTIQEVATALNKSVRWVQAAHADGLLKMHKVGGSLRIWRDDFEAFARSCPPAKPYAEPTFRTIPSCG